MVIADYKCKSSIPKKTYSYYSDSDFKTYHDSFPPKTTDYIFPSQIIFTISAESVPVSWLFDRSSQPLK